MTVYIQLRAFRSKYTQGKTRNFGTHSAQNDAAMLSLRNATKRLLRQDISQRPGGLRSIYDDLDASPARDVVPHDAVDIESEKRDVETEDPTQTTMTGDAHKSDEVIGVGLLPPPRLKRGGLSLHLFGSRSRFHHSVNTLMFDV